MTSNLFKVNLKDITGAIVSAVLVAVVGYLSTLTNILEADWNQILNVAIMAGIGSLLKALGTNSEGKFMGVRVK